MVDGGWKRADVGIRPYGVMDGESFQRIPGDALQGPTPSSARVLHQASASGKRKAGYPGSPRA